MRMPSSKGLSTDAATASMHFSGAGKFFDIAAITLFFAKPQEGLGFVGARPCGRAAA